MKSCDYLSSTHCTPLGREEKTLSRVSWASDMMLWPVDELVQPLPPDSPASHLNYFTDLKNLRSWRTKRILRHLAQKSELFSCTFAPVFSCLLWSPCVCTWSRKLPRSRAQSSFLPQGKVYLQDTTLWCSVILYLHLLKLLGENRSPYQVYILACFIAWSAASICYRGRNAKVRHDMKCSWETFHYMIVHNHSNPWHSLACAHVLHAVCPQLPKICNDF